MARSYSFDSLRTNRAAHREAAEMLRSRRVGVMSFGLGRGSSFGLGAALLARLGAGTVVIGHSLTAAQPAPRFVFA